MPIEEGAAESEHAHQIVRQVRVVRGSVHFQIKCFPEFDYVRAEHEVSIDPGGATFASGGQKLRLFSPVKLNACGRGVEAEFLQTAGDKVTFVLQHTSPGVEIPFIDTSIYGDSTFHETARFWRQWASGIRYRGRWQEIVERSALALKMLTFAPTGAIVAAPTTSLPEEIGGVRNWDYRYAWLRDSAFAIYGFIRLGLTREAEHFMSFIEARGHEEDRRFS